MPGDSGSSGDDAGGIDAGSAVGCDAVGIDTVAVEAVAVGGNVANGVVCRVVASRVVGNGIAFVCGSALIAVVAVGGAGGIARIGMVAVAGIETVSAKVSVSVEAAPYMERFVKTSVEGLAIPSVERLMEPPTELSEPSAERSVRVVCAICGSVRVPMASSPVMPSNDSHN